MYLLGIDTATNSGGVALSRNSEVVGIVMLKTPLRYSEKILSCVDFLLRQFDRQLSQIDCFAVATGPGSFTGLRVGLATVKAFSQGLDKPAVGVSTLEALAQRYCGLHPRVAPMIDARRQQVYGAVYRVEGLDLEMEQKAQVARPAQWLKGLPQSEYLFVGDGARLYKKTIALHHPHSRLLQTDNQLLAELCQRAYSKLIAGKTMSAEELKADYVRPSDALSKRGPHGAG